MARRRPAAASRRSRVTPSAPPAATRADVAPRVSQRSDALIDARQLWPARAIAAATAVLIALVMLPCLVPSTSNPYWDVDPRSLVSEDGVVAAMTMLGPADSAWVHVGMVLAAAGALGAHLFAGGRLRGVSCGLAMVGATFCVGHAVSGGAGSDHMLRGLGWVACAMAGLAGLHLAQHRLARAWLIAALAGVAVTWALEALWYVFVEHAMTVQHFLANEQSFLESRGWEAGSPQHLLYKRRAMFSDATGPFGLSNVFGSLAGAAAVLALGAAVWRYLGAVKGRRVDRLAAPIMLIVASVGGAVTVRLTNSRGALAALVLGLGLWVVVWAVGRLGWLGRRWSGWWLPWLGMAGVLAMWLGVAFAAWQGPPAPGQDVAEAPLLSILFRYHYAQGAWQAWLEAPVARGLVGVGPGGFQAQYVRLKPAINPEEVMSTHYVFLDYIIMLGLGGWAWSVLLVGWLWRGGAGAGRRLCATHDAQLDGQAPLRVEQTDASPVDLGLVGLTRWLPGLAAAAPFVASYLYQAPQMLPETMLLWLIGAGAFVALREVLTPDDADAAADRGEPWLLAGLFIAAAALMAHNQIEMTFFHPNAAGYAWLLMGVAAGSGAASGDQSNFKMDGVHLGGAEERASHDGDGDGGADRAGDPPSPKWAWAIPGVIALTGLVMIPGYAAPLWRHQAALAAGARDLQQGRPMAALAALDEAIAAASGAPKPYLAQVSLYLEWAGHVHQQGGAEPAREPIRRALAALDRAEAAGVTQIAIPRARAAAQMFAARILGEPDRLERALAARREVVARNPHGLQDHQALADLLWQMHRRPQARDVYQRCLTISEQSYLDPAKQLSEADRALIEGRLR